MDAFGIEEGFCGAGTARYAGGLLTLPDGSVRGVETITRLSVKTPEDGATRAGDVAGSLRETLGGTKPTSLPLRLALSTMRAGLGVIEEGLRPPRGVPTEIEFADGTSIMALMPIEAAALLRRDNAIARGVLDRVVEEGAPTRREPTATTADTAPDEALTSIFRYEKRNGRLRRVAARDKADE